MKKIPLTQGKVAIVDERDNEWLSRFNWHALRSRNHYYAVRSVRRDNGKIHNILMHREILNPPSGYETDHVNGDGLDNRRANLRIATHRQNQANSGMSANNTSGVKGCYWDKPTKKWRAQI